MRSTIFYSWQSDLPNNTNRGFIQSAIEKAAKSISAELEIEAAVERDTQGVPGSPDIASTIFARIESSDAFVADVSIISGSSKRKTPNPNVLVELGYALSAIGEQSVLMVMNTEFGGPEDLPFDLRKRRVLPYSTSPDDVDRTPEKTRLTGLLKAMIGEIVRAKNWLTDIVRPHVQTVLVESLKQAPNRIIGIWTDLPVRADLQAIQIDMIRKIEQVFRAANWVPVTTFDVQANPQPVGLSLVSHEGNTPPSEPDFGPIEKAFDSAKIAYSRARLRILKGYTNGLTTNDPVIYIGPVYIDTY